MSPKHWVSVGTLVMIGLIVFLSRHELVQAWNLLGNVNLWLLSLLIPGQIFVYYAAGQTVFTYLKSKGSGQGISQLEMGRMALELNFVNHVLPSGGISGISYMGWRLKQYGVPTARATMAQIVRYAVSFAAFILLLLIAVLIVTVDGNISRWIILVSMGMVSFTVGLIFGTAYLFSNYRRMIRFAAVVSTWVNRGVDRLTFGKFMAVLPRHKLEHFFSQLHDDYAALMRDRSVLKRPFIWAIVMTIVDVSMFVVTFLALGYPVNPAPILIAYGFATLASIVVATPGGAGAYEAIMVLFLAIGGLDKPTAIAGILLTRVILLLGTIMLGYAFYQHAIWKYEKTP